uniref:RCC1-like domain-containing protein n=1 Tax=Octactis speculum TaxID=3111310 RepID=A0A7S2HV15_9STRA|mmetsp:Transcript_9743/g.12720  ORF Transcript_9743/g.12720 Transcript_9743/m.12720 type:complete len:695 (+) Transcript_9743:46-2130(+)|eukprot:CAMPEP_0185776724 /NCGR_PEP_ID=MMETSP1174-20130828/86776_1 /TAXON_ID=35687 /ORGANISM="Dictyocha speculum, Strain CCMP1381" /LENGTH=694 /DNA_ID=CAMNT_0028464803 /DNA_START=30 /DNA_END=2114 /DNA_ORIENTATION=+
MAKFEPHQVSLAAFLLKAVEAQELTEIGRVKYPELSSVTASLIQTVKVGLHQFSKGRASTTISSSGELEATLDCTSEVLRKLNRSEPNYFGAFREEIFLRDLKNLSGRIEKVVDAIAAPREEKEYMMTDVEQLMTCIHTKVFWLKHFRRDCVEVTWSRFREAFESDYGKGILSEHLDKAFREALTQKGRKRAAATTDKSVRLSDSVNDDTTSDTQHHVRDHVSATHLDRITRLNTDGIHGGVFECFQRLCDPARVVYVMGTVEDDTSMVVARPTMVQGLLGLSIAQICCGGQHAAVLTSFGEVYTWGRGGFGRLGHGNTETLTTPNKVTALDSIVCSQVACGFAYTAVVTTEGALYTWGAGENGRLGLGDSEDRCIPSQVEDLSDIPIEQVFAGSVHTCVLSRTGHVYSCGKHEYTGHGATEDVLLPRILDIFQGKLIKQISVGPGGYHTIALTIDREVFTWGHNRVGQLGYSNSDAPRNVEGAHFLPTPKRVMSLHHTIRQVVAGWGHSAVLTVSGEVLICGRNYQGQLGLGSPEEFQKNERGHPFQAKFEVLDRLDGDRVAQIACGGEHTVALCKEENGSKVFSFGAGNKGQLGHGTPLANENFPRLVIDLKRTRRNIHQVACGNNCTVILAGTFNPPSLFDRAIEVIRGTPGLMGSLDAANLPGDLLTRIRNAPDMHLHDLDEAAGGGTTP